MPNNNGSLTFMVRGRSYAIGSDFDHPGGKQVLAEHSGQDITELFEGGQGGHAHSEAAWALLERFAAAGGQEPPAQDGSQPAAAGAGAAAAVQQPIDESQPLLWQVWHLGSTAYQDWVHRPVPGQPRFFESEWLERVTKVKWWVVPLLWLPLVGITFRRALLAGLPLLPALLLLAVGVLAWQLTEYCIHRFIFHIEPSSSYGIFLHFLFHGNHHKYPMDIDRLVFPPMPASFVIYAFYAFFHNTLPQALAYVIFSGMLLGYVCYDCMHYFQHKGLVGAELKAAHMHHHYVNPNVNYGISSPLYDLLFGTLGSGKLKAKVA